MHISILAPMCRVSIYPIIIFTMRLTPTIVQAEAVVCRISRERVRKRGRELNREAPPTIAAMATTATTTTAAAAPGQHYYVCVRAFVEQSSFSICCVRFFINRKTNNTTARQETDGWMKARESQGEQERETACGREQESNVNTLPRPNHVYHYIYGPWGLPTPITHCDFPQVLLFRQLYSALQSVLL